MVKLLKVLAGFVGLFMVVTCARFLFSRLNRLFLIFFTCIQKEINESGSALLESFLVNKR